ncbi:MAG: methyltransferase domain-containing protein [Planctomycetes bacterium]|nr:methyltransferase domain-containing protein [Planctomycetota bacterium]
MLELVSCNLCGSPGTIFLSRVITSPIEEVSVLVRCAECGLAYINPRPSVKKEKDFYASTYHEIQKPEVWDEDRRPFFQKSLNKINAYHWGGDKKLLDVGCGMGFFLDLARSVGWGVQGVDISRSAVQYGRKQFKLDVIEGELKEANLPDNSFDVVTSWNVLDQYYDPLGMAQETCRVLKKEGRAFWRVSNLNFHLRLHRFFKILPFWKKRRAPTVFHIYMFSSGSIKKLLIRAGFKKVLVGNSAPTPVVEDAARLLGRSLTIGANLIIFLIAQLVFYLSFKQLVIGPSLFVIAQKE